MTHSAVTVIPVTSQNNARVTAERVISERIRVAEKTSRIVNLFNSIT